MANQKKGKYPRKPWRTWNEHKAKSAGNCQRWFSSDWLRGWREIFDPTQSDESKIIAILAFLWHSIENCAIQELTFDIPIPQRIGLQCKRLIGTSNSKLAIVYPAGHDWLKWTVGRGAKKFMCPQPLPSPSFLLSFTPFVEIYFSPQLSVAVNSKMAAIIFTMKILST